MICRAHSSVVERHTDNMEVPSSILGAPTQQMLITFDDFKKVEIRIGRIVAAEKIPEGDKLLKLSVDFGTETRQIMSGIAEFFPDPSVLVGRQAPFVVNLETRTLRGYESQGMILATDGEKGIVLLHPAAEVPNGSLVK